jgi:hypothetical protein
MTSSDQDDVLGPPRGLALNRFTVECPGVHRLTRLPLPESRDARRDLERGLGVALHNTKEYAYASGELAEGSTVEVACDFDWGLHQFDLREALARQAAARGFRVWFARGGELHVAGLPGGRVVDGIDLQRKLRIRMTADEDRATLSARHGTRWLTASLADRAVGERSVGESAVRLSYGWPPRGEIVGVDGDTVTLRAGGKDVEVVAADYAITASAAYVRRHHGTPTLKALQVASGSITEQGQRNRYAVKDRFAALVEDMGALGWTIDVGGRQAKIEQEWAEIRVQEAL